MSLIANFQSFIDELPDGCVSPARKPLYKGLLNDDRFDDEGMAVSIVALEMCDLEIIEAMRDPEDFPVFGERESMIDLFFEAQATGRVRDFEELAVRTIYYAGQNLYHRQKSNVDMYRSMFEPAEGLPFEPRVKASFDRSFVDVQDFSVAFWPVIDELRMVHGLEALTPELPTYEVDMNVLN